MKFAGWQDAAVARPRSASVRTLVFTIGVTALALALAACSDTPRPGTGTSAEALTSTITIRRGTFGTVADATISAAALTKNYGAQKQLTVSAKNEALLRFDVSTIPANAVIDSATLTLAINGGEEEADDDGPDGDHEGHADPIIDVGAIGYVGNSVAISTNLTRLSTPAGPVAGAIVELSDDHGLVAVTATGADGRATAMVTLTSRGLHTYRWRFAGDAALAATESSTAQLGVYQRTWLDVSVVDAGGGNASLRATLRALPGNAPLTQQALAWGFDATSASSVTDGTGTIAQLVALAPGAHAWFVSFANQADWFADENGALLPTMAAGNVSIAGP